MGSNGEIGPQILILIHKAQHIFTPDIAVFADKAVVFVVLAEFPYAGGKDYQLAAVGNCHPGAVHGLVAEPGALKFTLVEINDDFFERLVHIGQVDILTQLHRLLKDVPVLADKQPVNECVVALVGRDGQHIQQRHVGKKMLLGIVEHLTHGRMILAHDALHAIESAEHMR